MKLSSKLTLLVLVAVLLPLFGLGTVVYFMQKQVTEERLQQQLQQQGLSAIQRIRDNLLENYRDLALVAGSSTLRPDVWTPEYGLRRYLTSFPMYDALIYTDQKGKLIAHAGSPLLTEGEASLEQAATDWHKAALAGVKLIDRVTPKSGAMSRYVVFARQVSDPGIVHGWVFAQVNSEKIVDLFERVKIGQTGHITLFNGKGILIGHPNKSRYGYDMSAYPIMRKPLAEGTGDSGNFFVSGDGREKWGLTMMLPDHPEFADLRWGVIVDQTRDELYGPISDLRKTILLGAAVFGFAFVLFGILFARRLIAPLFSIKRTLNGFFDYLSGKAAPPVHLEFPGDDEFTQMAKSIGESIRLAEKSITEQKRAEIERQESAKRYQTIIQTSFDGFWLVNLEGQIIDANDAAAKMLGYTREDLLRLAPKDIDVIDTPDEVHARIERMLKSGGERFETKHRKQSGEIIDVEASIKFLPESSALVVFVHDITHRKQAEAELLHSNAELEQFSYAISHDMRQPLRMIASYLQLLEMELGEKLDAEKRNYLDFAADGAKRLDQMLVSLLEYSRVGRKGEPLAWIDSRLLVDEALAFLAPAIKEAGAEVALQGDWPRVFVSRDEMVRLLQNLIGNAVKFRVKGRTPKVSVGSTANDKEWRITIADNGIGFAPTQTARLFQMFQRLHARSEYEGSGVGLALCRKIAEHHGGSIGAESGGEGQGCTITVALPRTVSLPATEE